MEICVVGEEHQQRRSLTVFIICLITGVYCLSTLYVYNFSFSNFKR
jgi:hypothetical protein